jgi:hypothetical protein
MRYLTFDLSEGSDGVSTLEAMASTRPADNAAVMSEVQQVLNWAWRHFPDQHGPVEEGMAWDHELLVQEEDGIWRTVTLTLTGAPHFVEAFVAEFGSPTD